MPPGVEGMWDANDIWRQAQLIAYNQIRCYEEDEDQVNMYRALGHKV